MAALQAGARTAGRALYTTAEVNAAIASSVRINAHGMARAQQGQRIWQGHVPVFSPARGKRAAPPYDQPGAARDAVRISVIRRGGRVAWRVGTTYFTAWWMEAGAKHMPKIAPREKTLAEMKGGGA